jgi:Flp pilus assembly protein TadB
MYRQYFVKSPILLFPLIAMVVFMTLFAVVVFRVWWQARNDRAKRLHDELSQLPLGTDSLDTRHEVVS